MTVPSLTTLCILTYGDYLDYYRRCLESILAHTPGDAFDLHLGFNAATLSLHYALGLLGPDIGAPHLAQLPGGVERFRWRADNGLAVCAWNSPVNLFKEPMARYLFHDVPLTSQYAIWFDDDSFVESGWWEGLLPLLQRRVDYIGQEWWVDYLPGQKEMIQAQPWYRGVPFEVRNGKPGVHFMTGGFLAVRSACLAEANFPEPARWKGRGLLQYGGDTLLGEIARQLGWSRAKHEIGIKVNVDLEGKHPAPRRGGIGRQFGADVEVAVK